MADVSHRAVAEFIAEMAWPVSFSGRERIWERIWFPDLDDMRVIYKARRTLKSMSEWKGVSMERSVDLENASLLMDRMFNAAMDGDKLRENAEVRLSMADRPVMEFAAHALLEYAIAADEEAGKKTHWKGRR